MRTEKTQSVSFYVKTLVLGLVVLAFAITKQLRSGETYRSSKLLVETFPDSE